MPTPTEKILQNLRNLSTSENSRRILEIISPIPSLMDSKSVEADALASPMIKLLASHNADIKEIVCEFLIKYSHPEVSVLAENILAQDIQDPNPKIRSLAVTTLSSLPSLNANTAINAIRRCCRDTNPSVRKSAVTGCGKFFFHSPEMLKDSDLIDVLYSVIKDTDPGVITFALQTLNVILKDEGGIVIPRSMAQFLLSRAQNLPELEFCFVMDYLQKYYTLKKDEEALYVMNVLDPFLDSKSGPVFLSTAKLFDKVLVGEKLRSDFVKRVIPQLGQFLRKSALASEMLEFVFRLHPLDEAEAECLYKDMRFKQKDSPEVLSLKVRVLRSKIRENAPADLKEEINSYLLNFCLTSGNDLVEKELILALCDCPRPELVLKLEEAFRTNKRRLVWKPILEHIRDISKQNDNLSFVYKNLCVAVVKSENVTHKQLSNVLWILNRRANSLPESPYLIEALHAYRMKELEKHDLLTALLSTAVNVFVHQPLAMQFTLGNIFESLFEKNNDLRQRVSVYSKILQSPDLIAKLKTNI